MDATNFPRSGDTTADAETPGDSSSGDGPPLTEGTGGAQLDFRRKENPCGAKCEEPAVSRVRERVTHATPATADTESGKGLVRAPPSLGPGGARFSVAESPAEPSFGWRGLSPRNYIYFTDIKTVYLPYVFLIPFHQSWCEQHQFDDFFLILFFSFAWYKMLFLWRNKF